MTPAKSFSLSLCLFSFHPSIYPPIVYPSPQAGIRGECSSFIREPATADCRVDPAERRKLSPDKPDVGVPWRSGGPITLGIRPALL